MLSRDYGGLRDGGMVAVLGVAQMLGPESPAVQRSPTVSAGTDYKPAVDAGRFSEHDR